MGKYSGFDNDTSALSIRRRDEDESRDSFCLHIWGYLDLGKNYATYGVAGHDDDSVNYRFMQLMFLIANCAAATVFHNDNNDDHTVKACAPRAFFSCATSELSVHFETILVARNRSDF